MKPSFRLKSSITPLPIILLTIAVPLAAQDDGGPLRLNRLAAKTPDTLAHKPGGPTERIEIQTTDDSIDYVVKAYVLKHANAAEIVPLITDAVDREGGAIARVVPGFAFEEVLTPEQELETSYSGESVLVITVPDWMIPYLDEAIGLLDRPGFESFNVGDVNFFWKPRYRRPSELAELMSAATASGIEVFVPDDTRNLIYIEDNPSFFPESIEALRYFDRPPDMIEVRARIFEIDESRAEDIGLDWMAWKKSVADGALTLTSMAEGTFDLDLETITGEITFNPVLATEFLNYLAARGHAEVITDTRLTLVNHEPAVIESVTDIPYILGGYLGGELVEAPLRDSPPATDADNIIKEFVEGVTISITPMIAGESIELRVIAAVASHVGYTPNQHVPIIASSTVESVLVTQSGAPAVLGGLDRTVTVRQRSGIPLLKEIAGIRNFFSREVERRRRSHIIITLVPNRLEWGEANPAESESVSQALTELNSTSHP